MSQSKELRQKLETSYRKNELAESLTTRLVNEKQMTEQQNVSSNYVSPATEPESGIGKWTQIE